MISAITARLVADEVIYNKSLEKAQLDTENAIKTCIKYGSKSGLYKIKIIVNRQCITVEFVNKLIDLGYDVYTECFGNSDVGILNVSWCKP